MKLYCCFTFSILVPKGHVWVEGGSIYRLNDSAKFDPALYSLLQGRVFCRVRIISTSTWLLIICIHCACVCVCVLHPCALVLDALAKHEAMNLYQYSSCSSNWVGVNFQVRLWKSYTFEFMSGRISGIQERTYEMLLQWKFKQNVIMKVSRHKIQKDITGCWHVPTSSLGRMCYWYKWSPLHVSIELPSIIFCCCLVSLYGVNYHIWQQWLNSSLCICWDTKNLNWRNTYSDSWKFILIQDNKSLALIDPNFLNPTKDMSIWHPFSE